MKVHELMSTNLNDQIRFYEESDIIDSLFIDEYTPYKWLSEVNLNDEIEYFLITVEEDNGEIEDYWISVVLKEEENA